MKLKPLEDRVVVRAVSEEQRTSSGLVIPDTAKEKPTLGEVVAVGDLLKFSFPLRQVCRQPLR